MADCGEQPLDGAEPPLTRMGSRASSVSAQSNFEKSLRVTDIDGCSREQRTVGLDWKALAGLPWIGTPPASVHHRLLNRLFSRSGVQQNGVIVVDQEPSMLAIVRSRAVRNLCRESFALDERQVHGSAAVEHAGIDAKLSFLSLASRQKEPSTEVAFDAFGKIWVPRSPKR